MLESFSLQRAAINSVLTKCNRNELSLSSNEWELLIQLKDFLQLFKKSVEIFSCDQIVSISSACVLRMEINQILAMEYTNKNRSIKELKKKHKERIDNCFPITDTLILASLLDPRFFNLEVINENLSIQGKTKTTFLMEQLGNNETTTVNTTSTNNEVQIISESTSTGNFFISLAAQHSKSNVVKDQPVLVEIKNYSETTVDNYGAFDLLTFWKTKKDDYIRLSRLARNFLCISATSTPSEHEFSVAGLLINQKRSTLCPTVVEKTVFIHDNYKICKEQSN